MSQSRRPDQGVDAFSAPKALIAEAKDKAIEMRLTKSGFYRYSLAKILGWSEEEAMAVAEHGAIRNAISAMHDARGSLPPSVNPEPNPTYKLKHRRKKE